MKLKVLPILLFFPLAFCLTLLTSAEATAESGFFVPNCVTCHNDDTVSCNACHAHGVWQDSSRQVMNLTATTDLDRYRPGQTITVTFSGGYRLGWIRAILYDHNNKEVDRVTGPTGMGNDGVRDLGLEFPVILSAPAPSAQGFYTWSVSWFGSPFDVANPVAYPHVEENVLTNKFEVLSPTKLTRINLASPSDRSTLSSPPTFVWTANGGTRNQFFVDITDFSDSWSTEGSQPVIYGTRWTVPASIWSKIPSGKRMYWRVCGLDTARDPQKVIISNELWSFYKK